MGYPTIQTPPVSSNSNCAECIVTLPVQSTTSMRFNMNITQGENLVLKHVGTINATYASDNVAQELVTILPGAFFSINQNMIALCIQVSSPALVNLIMSGGTAVAFNVSNMLFIDEALEGVEVSVPTGTGAAPVTVSFFYAMATT
jgi:hypothetical protein